MRVRISFAQVECTRCGDRRIVTRACPACGEAPRPGEFDVKAQRRRRAADAIRALAQEAGEGDGLCPRPAGDELTPLLKRLGLVPGRTFELLGSVDRGGEAEAQAVDGLLTLYGELLADQRLAHRTWLRPWRRHGRLAAAVADSFRQAVDEFVAAFSAADLHIALAHASAGQQQLDEAAETADLLLGQVEFLEQCLDSSDELDLVALCLTRELDRVGPALVGTSALVAMEEAGRGRLPFLTDEDSDGLGLQAQVVLLTSDLMLDSEQLVAVACAAHAVLDHARLEELTADAFWRERHQGAASTLLDACRDLADLASTTEHSARRGTRAQLAFIQDLVEGPIRHHLSTLLACRPSPRRAAGVYKASRGNSGRAPVDAARKALEGILTEGILVAGRHASAHVDYVIDGDRVILQASRSDLSETVTQDELTDAVLSALESSLGLSLALSAMSEAMSETAEDDDLLSELDPHLFPTVLLSASGWRDLRFSRAGDTLTVTGSARASLPITSIAMILAKLDEEVRWLVLIVEDAGLTRQFRADADAFRRHRDRDRDDEDEDMLSFMSALAHVTVNGVPLVARPTMRHFIAVLAGQRVNAPLASAAPWLGRLRRWADEHGDAELSEVLGSVQKVATALAMELPVGVGERAALDLLGSWEATASELPTHW